MAVLTSLAFTVVQSFTTTGRSCSLAQGRVHNYFERKRKRVDPLLRPHQPYQQRNEDKSSFSSLHSSTDDDSTAGELHFNMINLIQDDEDEKRQARKLKSLYSIFQACSLVDEKHYSSDCDNDEDLPEQLAPFRRFFCTSAHAKDHQGCFQIFNRNVNEASSKLLPPSLPSNVLFSMDKPFTFLRDSLSYQSKATREKNGGMMYDSQEALVWCCFDSEIDLEYSSRVLDDMPFSRLHLGSALGRQQMPRSTDEAHTDGNNCLVVELDLRMVETLQSMGICRHIASSTRGDNNSDLKVLCKLKSDDLDIIQSVLSCNFLINESKSKKRQPQSDQSRLEQKTLIQMIDVAVESVRKDPLNRRKEPHLVLMAHSISASVVASAISTWKQQQIQQQKQKVKRVEDLLNQALTVVTFGNVHRSFCDGPAYIHISMYDDPWTTALGSTSSTTPNAPPLNNAESGGLDAVYFNALSPYFEYDQEKSLQSTTAVSSLKSHNAHNLNACTIQYLCLIMRINGIQSFRALYDEARFVDPIAILDINPKHFAVNCKHGELVIPPKIDYELLPAMIQASGGDQWIWKSGDGDHDEDESCLPDDIEARSHLEENFGYSVYEEIYATCCSSTLLRSSD